MFTKRTITRRTFGGVLLAAALPILSQTQPARKTAEILRFTLSESPEEIVKLLGRPEHMDESLPGFQSWQYETMAGKDSDDNSPPAWFVCLRSGRTVLSVTRNFDKPQDVDDLFPPAQTTAYHWPAQGAPQYSLRLRRISGEVLLLAMGTAKPGERTTQLMLIRQSVLKTFMPWLAEQLP